MTSVSPAASPPLMLPTYRPLDTAIVSATSFSARFAVCTGVVGAVFSADGGTGVTGRAGATLTGGSGAIGGAAACCDLGDSDGGVRTGGSKSVPGGGSARTGGSPSAVPAFASTDSGVRAESSSGPIQTAIHAPAAMIATAPAKIGRAHV